MSEPHGQASAGRIVGRYVLHDEIAAGGMATVHLGRLVGPVGFSRTIAIKRLHPHLARDPEFAAKFLEEARLASRVRHANVVSVTDVVAVADELFLVMEYVQGESLSRLARVGGATEGAIPQGIALTIVADALHGLHAAHETKSENGEPLRIVHRDVSPQNIVVGIDGVSRVLDFGVAKAASQAQTDSDVLKGKIAYMSPEQISREPVDRRADVFAASIVLWELLTGKRLFAADEHAAVLHRVLHDAIEPPSVHAPGLPPAVDAIVMKGLARDVSQRFATAQEMATAIEASMALARPAEIGAWVERTAGAALRQRADRIAEIEGTPSASARPATSPAAPGADGGGEPTMMLREPDGMDAVPDSLTKSEGGSRRHRRAALAFVVTAGVLFAASRLWRAAPHSAAPVVSATKASAEPNDPPRGTALALPSSSVPAAVSAAPAEGPHAATSGTVGAGLSTRAPRRNADCNPPYYFDRDGVKRFKPKCL